MNLTALGWMDALDFEEKTRRGNGGFESMGGGGARARVYGRIQIRSRLHSAGHHLEECVQESRNLYCRMLEK